MHAQAKLKSHTGWIRIIYVERWPSPQFYRYNSNKLFLLLVMFSYMFARNLLKTSGTSWLKLTEINWACFHAIRLGVRRFSFDQPELAFHRAWPKQTRKKHKTNIDKSFMIILTKAELIDAVWCCAGLPPQFIPSPYRYRKTKPYKAN